MKTGPILLQTLLLDGETWSFDSPDFDRFVDLVEGGAAFQELAVNTPLHSSVYYLET